MSKLVVPAVLLALAAALLVVGVALLAGAWAWIAAGALLAVWSLLFTLDLPAPRPSQVGDGA